MDIPDHTSDLCPPLPPQMPSGLTWAFGLLLLRLLWQSPEGYRLREDGNTGIRLNPGFPFPGARSKGTCVGGHIPWGVPAQGYLFLKNKSLNTMLPSLIASNKKQNRNVYRNGEHWKRWEKLLSSVNITYCIFESRKFRKNKMCEHCRSLTYGNSNLKKMCKLEI